MKLGVGGVMGGRNNGEAAGRVHVEYRSMASRRRRPPRSAGPSAACNNASRRAGKTPARREAVRAGPGIATGSAVAGTASGALLWTGCGPSL